MPINAPCHFESQPMIDPDASDLQPIQNDKLNVQHSIDHHFLPQFEDRFSSVSGFRFHQHQLSIRPVFSGGPGHLIHIHRHTF